MKRASELFGWIGSSALLVAIPKCPACLAAYVMLWTGLGLSFATATYLRYGAIAVCFGALAYLAFYRIRKTRAKSKGSKKHYC